MSHPLLLACTLLVGSSGITSNAQAQQLRDEYHQAPRDTVPHLIASLKAEGPVNTRELFIETVCAGRPALGMPAWCPLGMEIPTIEKIYAYVKGRSDAKIGPGRPALKPET